MMLSPYDLTLIYIGTLFLTKLLLPSIVSFTHSSNNILVLLSTLRQDLLTPIKFQNNVISILSSGTKGVPELEHHVLARREGIIEKWITARK